MKSNSKFTISATVLGLLFAAQIVYFFLPNRLVVSFNRICVPTLYLSVAVILFAFIGREERPIPKATLSVLLAGIGAAFYFFSTLAAGILFGFQKNVMVSSVPVILNNLLTYAIVACASEYLRMKLIKNTTANRRGVIAVATIFVFSIAQLNTLRSTMSFNAAELAEFFFTMLFPALTLNTVLSYMAFSAPLRALLIIRSTYSLTPIFMPVLPNVPGRVWSVVCCAILLVTAIVYHKNMNGKTNRRIVDKRAKYHKRPIWTFSISAISGAFLIAFFSRAFAYFPAVILTDSMAGMIDSGSIVIIQKLPTEEIASTISEGDIICYQYRQIEITHRVISFHDNAAGERVYITKGDANPAEDINPVEMKQVVGIVRSKIPYIGYPALLVRNFLGGYPDIS